MQIERTAALHNLGCKVNAYETEVMAGLLKNAGYRLVDFDEKADVYVINTCSVTNIADKKSRQMIRQAKRRNEDACVVACGCFVNTAEAQVLDELPIDIRIGNNERGKLISLLSEFFHEGEGAGNEAYTRHLSAVSDINKKGVGFEDLTLSENSGHTRAFIKVQDGCDMFCTYCIIPFARGRARSKDKDSVINEVRGLAAAGYREIIINGIHLSSYGRDTGSSLLELIKAVHEVDGVERIRLGSLEPGIVTEEFAGELAALGKICPHFHLSLQSGSDTVLKRMNRRYDTATYLQKCDIIRKHFEHPAITTDVITGFPGETEEEFAETFEFVKKAGFYELHVFPYSVREGTKAAEMPGQLTESVKKRRANILIDLGAVMSEEFRAYYAGREVEVLFEEKVGDEYVGYSREYVRYSCKSDEDLINRICRIMV